MSSGHHPPAYPINELKLATGTDSKIINVNLYSNRAEISRSYKATVKSGQNQVVISGLSNFLDQGSVRVEGRGAATIHDVTISRQIPEKAPQTSPRLEELFSKKEGINKALERCKKTLGALGGYLGSVNAEHVNVSNLVSIMDNYNTATEKYDALETGLRRELTKVGEEIAAESASLAASVAVDGNLLMRATIGVFAGREGQVEIILIYAVSGASWVPGYDVRVNTQTKESPVELVYKAAITQRTGESWQDVPLTLETAEPTFGLNVPTISSWTLSLYKAPVIQPPRATGKDLRWGRTRVKETARRSTSAEEIEEEDDDMGFGLFDDGPEASVPMVHTSAGVTSQGGISATFRVPGLITVPSDGTAHNVTIVELTPEAKLLWLSIPAVDPRTHLTSKIKNTSEYTFLSGTSSVYVDGSFISKAVMPLVSPQESFTYPLGLDPSIRITYHPQVKKASQSGLITKTSSTTFSQRITVHNSKTTPVDRLTIVDRIHISQDAQISIKLTSPELVLPTKPPAGLRLEVKVPPPVKVTDGVVAQWHGAGEEGVDAESLGKDGKVDWVCSVPPQKKLNLQLQWEVSTPVQAVVIGL